MPQPNWKKEYETSIDERNIEHAERMVLEGKLVALNQNYAQQWEHSASCVRQQTFVINALNQKIAKLEGQITRLKRKAKK